VGALSPLHCTALGKAYLAFGTRVVPVNFARFTASTIVDRAALETDLVEARRLGYARDDEEFSPGVRCVASAIRDGNGRMVAAVGLSGPTARLDLNRLADLGRLVRDRTAEVSVPTNGIRE
jgi:DNA-binding IclR family transcriptional regulator